MIWVRPIKPVISVRPTDKQPNRRKFPQFVLNCVHGQAGYRHQLTDVALFRWSAKERA